MELQNYYLVSIIFSIITLLVLFIEINFTDKKYVVIELRIKKKINPKPGTLIILLVPFINNIVCLILWVVILISKDSLKKLIDDDDSEKL